MLAAYLEVVILSSNESFLSRIASNIKIIVIIFVVEAGYSFSLEFLSYRTCFELASIRIAALALGVTSLSNALTLVIGNKHTTIRVINIFFINLIASINNMSKIDKNTLNNQ